MDYANKVTSRELAWGWDLTMSLIFTERSQLEIYAFSPYYVFILYYYDLFNDAVGNWNCVEPNDDG